MQRILLASVPDGLPKEADFRFEEVPEPGCPENGMLVETRWISVDPYLRGRISGKRSYVEPIRTGEPMVSGAVGRVLESKAPAFAPGDLVTGLWAWQPVVALASDQVEKAETYGAPEQTAIGILGMPGMTAYFGLTEVCQPRQGETLLVSGAAGAVGSAVGQIGKILGCRVVGTAGSDEKTAWLRSHGFDGALNYRTDTPYQDRLRELCPEGVDCYFDNVGGEITDAAVSLLNTGARVAVCGQIAIYNDPSRNIGPRPYWQMIARQVRMEGFLVYRWKDRWPEGRRQMAAWLKEGRLGYEETVYDALDSAPRAFIGLFKGENTGKALVRVKQD